MKKLKEAWRKYKTRQFIKKIVKQRRKNFEAIMRLPEGIAPLSKLKEMLKRTE